MAERGPSGLRRRRKSGDDVNDYYELLGIERGADKDAVRSAYRDRLEGATQSERAQLNKAWNVLSDPAQRARYDGSEASGSAQDADADADDDAAVVPARASSRTGARPTRGGGKDRPARGERRPRPPAREPLAPTLELPDGMEFADPRQRGTALLIDFIVLFVVYFLAFITVIPGLVDSRYPAQTNRIDAINQEIKQLDKEKSNFDDRADNSKLSKPERDDAKAESKSLDRKINQRQDQITTISKDFQGFALVLYTVILAVMLAIVVPATALTGQTLGMRLRKVRVVRVDGAPVGWFGAFARFVVPMALALFIPSIGAIAGLGMVVWFFRDRNRQGLHDKLAKTVVVAAD